VKKRVVAFGEILWDLLPTGKKLGGAPFNFAYRVNSLGDSGIIASRLGRDALGKEACGQVVSLGMDASYIQWDETAPTGTVEITLDENKNPDYFIVPAVAYDNTELTEPLLDIARTADCLCFGTLMQRTLPARKTLESLLDASKTAVKLLDINLRKNCYTTETIARSLEHSNVLKLNDDEARYLAELFDLPGDSAAFSDAIVQKFSLDCCVITFGERGAFAASAGDEKAYAPGYKVNVIDSCGSGDAFAAGFIYRYLRGQPLRDCCELGNAMGAMVAAQPGATIPILKQEIDQFVRANHARTSEPSLVGKFTRTDNEPTDSFLTG
jgi:fructokinase